MNILELEGRKEVNTILTMEICASVIIIPLRMLRLTIYSAVYEGPHPWLGQTDRSEVACGRAGA